VTLLSEVLADTPALLWKCDGSTVGAALTDDSGNGRNGSVSGTLTPGPNQASIVPSQTTKSLGFNGTGASNYAFLAHDAGLDVGTGDFAIEFWCICNNGTGNYVQVLGRDDSASGNGQIVYLNNGDGHIRFYIGGTTTGSNNRLSDGRLHHVVVQRVSGHGQIYIDDVLEADTTGMTGNCDTGSAFRLGVVDGSFLTFNGTMQYVAYYTHGLAADRVHAHYAAGLTTMVSDAFTRANDSSHLGSADTGQAWTAQLGTWGISGNTAYCSDGYSAGNGGSATVDPGAGVREVQVEISVKPPNSDYQGVVLRYSDSNNYWFAFVYTGATGGHDPFVYAGKCVAGAFSYSIVSAGSLVGVATPYVLRLAANEYDVLEVSVNDVVYGLTTDSFNNTAQLVGLLESGNANSFDNFKALGTGTAGSSPTTYTVSMSGAVTPAGALLKTVAKSPAGSVSSSGGLFLVGPDGVFLTGSLSPTGALSLHVEPAPVVGDQTLRAGFLPIA
jgi:hypothetical protein